MTDKGIFFDLTPTAYNHLFLKIMEPIDVLSPAWRSDRASADARHDQHYDQLVQRVLKSGEECAAGSDWSWYYLGKTRGQG
jgi:hypothetical protein